MFKNKKYLNTKIYMIMIDQSFENKRYNNNYILKIEIHMKYIWYEIHIIQYNSKVQEKKIRNYML